MFKNKLTWLGVILMLVCSLFIFAACSSGSTDSSADKDAEDTAAADTAEIESTIPDTIDDLKADYDKLKTEAESATGEDAAALKSVADHELEDIDSVEAHLEKDLESDKITKDAYDTAKSDLDTLKTDFTDVSTKLESAAAGATARAEDLAEGNAFLLKTKDDVDKEMTRVEGHITNLKDRAEKATADDKEYLLEEEKDFETHLDNLEKRVERLTTEGTLSEDEKKAYDDTIGKLKDDLASAKETLDKIA